MFQNITQVDKKQVILLMIPNGERHEAKSEGRWRTTMVLSCSKESIRIIKNNNV